MLDTKIAQVPGTPEPTPEESAEHSAALQELAQQAPCEPLGACPPSTPNEGTPGLSTSPPDPPKLRLATCEAQPLRGATPATVVVDDYGWFPDGSSPSVMQAQADSPAQPKILVDSATMDRLIAYQRAEKNRAKRLRRARRK